jgi:hypothetical protein
MWRLLILSALVALTTAQAPGGLFGGAAAEWAEPRLGATAIRIFQLEHRIDKIKEKLHEAEKHENDPEVIVGELEARVENVEGNGCGKRQFQCGGHDRECISDLLVCDGHNDCHNEHDEDEDVCSTAPVKAGNIFAGHVKWISCAVRDDHPFKISITGTRRSKHFTSRVRVAATVSADIEVGADHHHEIKTYVAHGFYNFGTRKLVVFPDDGHFKHLGLVCEFNLGDNQRARCSLGQVASRKVCATAFVNLQ